MLRILCKPIKKNQGSVISIQTTDEFDAHNMFICISSTVTCTNGLRMKVASASLIFLFFWGLLSSPSMESSAIATFTDCSFRSWTILSNDFVLMLMLDPEGIERQRGFWLYTITCIGWNTCFWWCLQKTFKKIQWPRTFAIIHRTSQDEGSEWSVPLAQFDENLVVHHLVLRVPWFEASTTTDLWNLFYQRFFHVLSNNMTCVSTERALCPVKNGDGLVWRIWHMGKHVSEHDSFALGWYFVKWSRIKYLRIHIIATSRQGLSLGCRADIQRQSSTWERTSDGWCI